MHQVLSEASQWRNRGEGAGTVPSENARLNDGEPFADPVEPERPDGLLVTKVEAAEHDKLPNEPLSSPAPAMPVFRSGPPSPSEPLPLVPATAPEAQLPSVALAPQITDCPTCKRGAHLDARLRLTSGAAANPPLPAPSKLTFDSSMSLSKRSCVGDQAWKKRLVWDVECGHEHGRNSDFVVMEAEDTFELMRKGASIFRFGDGELRLMSGSEQINHGMEVGSKDLRLWLHAAASMGGVAKNGAACVGLVGMMDGKTDRFAPDSGIKGWTSGAGARKYQKVIKECFPVGRYCSASITRPDHLRNWGEDRLVAEWASVFAGKVVLYIRPQGMFSSSHAGLFGRARAVIAPDFLPGARRSFKLREKIMSRIHEELRRTKIDMVALSLGPTATVIAAELACQGVQAFDFGSWTRRR